MKKRYFIVASIFLFNPVVSVFDIFPDFIGYLLIMKAFSEASYVYDNASETQSAFKQMTIISIFKLISMIILPFTDATMALVFSFSFAIIEILFGIGAYQKLFDSVSFICMRCGEDRFVARSEKLKKFTLFFFFTRVICSTVPDFCALFLSDPQREWMYRFRTLLFFLFTIVATIVGIIWLVRVISFFKLTLTNPVKEKIAVDFTEEMKDRQSVFFSKDFIFAIALMTIAMIFNIDLYIDGIEFLSDILLAPIFAIGFFFLVKKKHIAIQKYEKLLIASLSVHFISSILNTIFTMTFDKEYLVISVLRNEQTKMAYIPVVIATILEAIAFLGIALTSLYLVNKYALQRIYENPRFFSEYSVDGYVEEFKSSVRKKSIFSAVVAILSFESSIVYVFERPYDTAFVVLNVLIAIAFFVSYLSALSYPNEEVFKKILKYS